MQIQHGTGAGCGFALFGHHGLTTPAPRLSELAYERILEGLFARRVQVGALLSQAELSALVDVLIAPLRAALRMLEAEGVLTIHPRSGIQFVRPGLELTHATYQFRSIIERAAVRVPAAAGPQIHRPDHSAHPA